MGKLEFLKSLQPDEVVFWTGAGISADPPTCGPIGWTLKDRALTGYFRSDIGNYLKQIYLQLKAPNAAYRPRLETVLDALTVVYGSHGLADVMSDLEKAIPNDVHRFFAQHLKAGGLHVTANFDTCIERALPGTPDAYHFHGKIDSTDGFAALGARMSIIENGFVAATVEDLDAILGASKVKALIFAGYSGSDFFDGTPYLRSRWPLLRGKCVIWHDFQTRDDLLSGPDCDSHPHLRAARLAGAEVYLSRGSLCSALSDLASAWGWPKVETHGPLATPWQAEIQPTARQRVAASVGLASRMGLHKLVSDTVEQQGGPESPEQSEQYADALWGEGRYRAARSAWRSAFVGSDDTSAARWAEREGAVFWIRGQYLRAERHLRLACETWASPTSCIPLETQAALAETYGRVLTHMRRTPDTRLFSSSAKRAVARERINRIQEEMAGREGIHRRAKTQSVMANLSSAPDVNLADHIATFEESEALHAWLSYKHHSIRQRAQEGSLPSREELESLIEARNTIGAYGDAALVFLLPGANQMLSIRRFFQAISRIDVTSWHRLRISMKFLFPYIKRILMSRRKAMISTSGAVLAIIGWSLFRRRRGALEK